MTTTIGISTDSQGFLKFREAKDGETVNASGVLVDDTGVLVSPDNDPTVTIQYADAEIPSGNIDSNNETFTLLHAPNPANSLRLYVNGLLNLANKDYVLTGSTVVFGVAPLIKDILTAWYRY